jgi:hypothetical protein
MAKKNMEKFSLGKPSPKKLDDLENKEKEKFHPEIKFGYNPNLDKFICWTFFKNSGKIFLNGLKLEYPIKDEEATKQKISEAVDKFYQENDKGVKESVGLAELSWQEVESSFYNKVDELFSGYDWPKAKTADGKYKANGSILNIFPRFIEEKSFCFPAKPREAKKISSNRVIAHEMLHFITYDYLEKKYNLKPSEAGDKDNKFWQFTENLNALIEGDPMWSELMEGDEPDRMPECADLYDEMEKIWSKNKNLDNLIEKVFNVKKI